MADLTHPLDAAFPTFGGGAQFAMRRISSRPESLFNVNEWTVDEHTGTHLDAPFHVSDGPAVDRLAAEAMVGPLAVIDIRAKAAADPDACCTADDVRTWEAKHGRLPESAVVAMCSGWDAFVGTPRFRNADADGVLHFPGFAADAAAYLLEYRGAKGLVVDTLSLDAGSSKDFPVHMAWLPAGHWGVECCAGLTGVPAAGAHVIVGVPKVVGATGSPCRVLALIG